MIGKRSQWQSLVDFASNLGGLLLSLLVLAALGFMIYRDQARVSAAQ